MATGMTYKLLTRGPSDEQTLIARLSMGTRQTVIGNVAFNGLDANHRRKVVQAFGEPSKIWFKRICSSDDFKTYMPLVCYLIRREMFTLGNGMCAVA